MFYPASEFLDTVLLLSQFVSVALFLHLQHNYFGFELAQLGFHGDNLPPCGF